MEKSFKVALVHKDRYLVREGENELYCIIAGSLRYEEKFPVVGDYVDVIENPYGDSLIKDILPRKSVFCRPERSGHSDVYVKTIKAVPLVANIDYVFIITSLNNDFSTARIARYAATAISGGAVPVAVLTKADICPDVDKLVEETKKISDRIEVVAISSLTGYGLENLKKYFVPGNTIALLGSSGAGKSTLINRLAGYEAMKTGGIRKEDSKGRHTTTHREIVTVDGVDFIDTPGLRELGMIDAGEGIADTFSDIVELAGRCKYSDCSHSGEPGCAIKAALEDGTLSGERYAMYMRLEKENNWSKAKKNEQMMNVALKRRNLNMDRKKR